MSDDSLLAHLQSTLGSAYLLERELGGGGTAPAAFEPGMPRSVILSLTVGRLR